MKMPSGKPKRSITELLKQAIDARLFNLASHDDCTLLDIKQLKESEQYFNLVQALLVDLHHRTETALHKLKEKPHA